MLLLVSRGVLDPSPFRTPRVCCVTFQEVLALPLRVAS